MVYSMEEHGEGTKRALEEAGVLASFTVVEGGAHYLSWGKGEVVNQKIIEVMG